MLLALVCGTCLGSVSAVRAEDMRQLQSQARQALMEKAAQEKLAAESAAAQSRKRIRQSRQSLEAELGRLSALRTDLQTEIGRLEKQARQLAERETGLVEELRRSDQMVRELVGNIRINAKDIGSLLSSNLVSAVKQDDFAASLDDIGGEGRFPSMDDIRVWMISDR